MLVTCFRQIVDTNWSWESKRSVYLNCLSVQIKNLTLPEMFGSEMIITFILHRDKNSPPDFVCPLTIPQSSESTWMHFLVELLALCELNLGSWVFEHEFIQRRILTKKCLLLKLLKPSLINVNNVKHRKTCFLRYFVDKL